MFFGQAVATEVCRAGADEEGVFYRCQGERGEDLEAMEYAWLGTAFGGAWVELGGASVHLQVYRHVRLQEAADLASTLGADLSLRPPVLIHLLR